MFRALVVTVGLTVAGTWVGAVCAEAQSQQDVDQASAPHRAASSATTQGAGGSDAARSGAAAKPKPKKVWTDENMGDVTGTISVVGTAQPRATTTSRTSSLQPSAPVAPNSKQGGATKSGDEVDPKVLAQVKQEVQKMQAGIDQLDKQIEQLKGLSRGDSKNTGGLNADTWSYSTATIPDQIKTLESKRSALQTSLDNLMDAARERGIEPGQLR